MEELSYLLNFPSNISVDIDEALGDFEKHKFGLRFLSI
jgi:hypothetical protein